MKRCKVKCGNARLTAPKWVERLWPSDMEPSEWPTFCGAGDGIGDALVPDKIRGVRISPACFIHDIGWATSKETVSSFLAENWYLAWNIRALIVASELAWWKRELAVIRAWAIYFVAVSTIGMFAFDPLKTTDEEYPLDNAIVRARLRRLANARIGIADTDPETLTDDTEGAAI